MKRIKKNHLIITALAIMIAVAGYINYAGDLDNIIKINDKKSVSTALEAEGEEEIDLPVTDEPGTAILTNATLNSEAVSVAKLNREQIRASAKEELQAIIDNKELSEESKARAVSELSDMVNYANQETAIELLLSAKGYDNSVVSVTSTGAEVVLPVSEISDKDKAVVEDLIKRKTDLSADKITINICNN